MKKPIKNKIQIEKSHDETFYLLKSKANAKRLLTALEEHEKGLGHKKTLIEN